MPYRRVTTAEAYSWAVKLVILVTVIVSWPLISPNVTRPQAARDVTTSRSAWHYLVGRLNNLVTYADYMRAHGASVAAADSGAFASSHEGGSPCHLTTTLGQSRCFSPSDVATAEHMMPARPIRPVEIVRRTTGLALTAIVVNSLQGRAAAIHYVFGRYCWKRLFGCPTKYVEVVELPGAKPYQHPVIVRDRQSFTSPAGATTVQMGPWTLLASIPGHPLSLQV